MQCCRNIHHIDFPMWAHYSTGHFRMFSVNCLYKGVAGNSFDLNLLTPMIIATNAISATSNDQRGRQVSCSFTTPSSELNTIPEASRWFSGSLLNTKHLFGTPVLCDLRAPIDHQMVPMEQSTTGWHWWVGIINQQTNSVRWRDLEKWAMIGLVDIFGTRGWTEGS